MYHGVVLKNSNYFSPRHITADQFEKHLQYFTREFEIVSLEDVFEKAFDARNSKRKFITISFDDGYKNNLDTVLPLLEKYKIKSTFFISGICTEEMKVRALWPDIVACLAYFKRNELVEIGDYRFINLKEEKSGFRLSEILKHLQPVQHNLLLEEIIDKYNIKELLNKLPPEIWLQMNREEIAEFSRSEFVTIGSHGFSHYNLANVSIDEATSEMKRSKNSLEEVTGKPIDLIAYADGSYNEEVKNQAEMLGYKGQLAVKYLLESDKTDPRILNRHGISSTTTFASNMFFMNMAFQDKGFNVA